MPNPPSSSPITPATGKTAVILAGGKGTRLKPFTNSLPKPLIPLGNTPVLELIIQQLKLYGFTNITLAVGHLSELIKAYFGDGAKWGVNLHYVFESHPLGTAGPLLNIPNLSDDFLVLNADLVTELNLADLFETHVKQGNMATLAVNQRTTQIEFGVLELAGERHQITQFNEKPTLVHSVCMGIHALNKQALSYLNPNEFCGIDQLMARMMNDGHAIYAFPFEGYWLDIGRHTDYETAQADFERMQHRLLPRISPASTNTIIGVHKALATLNVNRLGGSLPTHQPLLNRAEAGVDGQQAKHPATGMTRLGQTLSNQRRSQPAPPREHI
jgi:NDP-mannose synthase